MPQASRKKFDENLHFKIEKDVLGGKVVRWIISCKKCKKQKVFPGQPSIVHHLCCDRALEFETAAGKLPDAEPQPPVSAP